MAHPLTVTPPLTVPIKLFCPPSVPTNEGVAVGVEDEALGVAGVVVPLGAGAAALLAAGGMATLAQPLTVTPPFTFPTKLFCPPSVP